MAKYIFEEDGLYEVTVDPTHSQSTTFYATDMYGATVEIHYVTPHGLVLMGTLKENSYLVISHGYLHKLVAVVTGVTNTFEITYNKGGSTNYSAVLDQIQENTARKLFTDLDDTPTSYAGQKYKAPLVSEFEDGLSFQEVVLPGGTTSQVSIGSFNTTASQIPTGLGAANSIIVHYGQGGLTNDGEFLVRSDGIVERLSGDDQVDMEVVIKFVREQNAGLVKLAARLMYAPDGINYVQLGDTFGVLIDSQNYIWSERFSLKLDPLVGSKMYVEVARDPSGYDSGSIGTFPLTGDMENWNIVPSASINILKTIF